MLQLHEALAAWERTAIEQRLTQPTLHVDETSLRVDRQNHWIHVCSGADITLKFLHPQRGRQAITAINLIPARGGSSATTAGPPTWPTTPAVMAGVAPTCGGN